MGEFVTVESGGLKKLAQAARRADRDIARTLRTGLKAAGEIVARDARSRAAFSSRIPSSIKVSTARGSVTVKAGGSSAPDAAPIENKGKGHVRHPVFGHMNVWTDKNSPPAYLHPALDAKREEAHLAVREAVLETVRLLEGKFT